MQFVDVSKQLLACLWGLFLGVGFALCYDGVRIFRRLMFGSDLGEKTFVSKLPGLYFCKNGLLRKLSEGTLTNILDIVYSAFISVSFCIYVYHMNSGRPRWFLFLSVALGFVLYRLSIGKLVMLFAGYIASVLRSLLSFALWLCSMPPRLLWRLLKLIIAPFVRGIKRRIDLNRTEKVRKKLAFLVRFSDVGGRSEQKN